MFFFFFFALPEGMLVCYLEIWNSFLVMLARSHLYRERERERVFQWVVVYLKTKNNFLPCDNEFLKMRTIFHVRIMVKLMIKFRIL